MGVGNVGNRWVFFVSLGLLFILLIGSAAAYTIIQGAVVGVENNKVKITYKGAASPSKGDSVEIGFKLDDELIMVEGDWRVVDVDASFAWAQAKGEHGEPSLDYIAQIRSAHPSKRAELSPSAKNGVLLIDTFDDDRHGWGEKIKKRVFSKYFENGVYVIETSNEMQTRAYITPDIIIHRRLRIEVDTTWLSGIGNKLYGLLIGSDIGNRYEFNVTGNGYATVDSMKNGEDVDGLLIHWKENMQVAKTSDGNTVNRLRVDLDGDQLTYYVNDKKIGTIENTLIKSRLMIGLHVINKQRVAFDNLRITAIE